MPARHVLVFVLVLVACVAPSGAARAAVVDDAGKCKVVVLGMTGSGLSPADEAMTSTLTEALVAEIGAVSACDVVSKAEISSLFAYEADRALCTDGSTSCLAEVADAFGADLIVAGSIGRLGADYVLSARRMNVKTGAVERRAEEVVSGAPEQLRNAAKNLGRTLFDKPPLPVGAAQAGAPPAGGVPWLLVGGGALAAAGVLVAGGATAVALFAEARMGEPAAKDKGDMRTVGLVAAGAAGIGVVVIASGGALCALAMVE